MPPRGPEWDAWRARVESVLRVDRFSYRVSRCWLRQDVIAQTVEASVLLTKAPDGETATRAFRSAPLAPGFRRAKEGYRVQESDTYGCSHMRLHLQIIDVLSTSAAAASPAQER